MFQRLVPLLCVMAACTAMAACKGEVGDGEGGECQPCFNTTPRCDAGLTCSQFRGGGKTMDLCAKPSTNSCSVP